ncbi:MAG: hypothetical protein BWY15_02063 [Firmicutes bacterium ADurb.Bin193]|nr:MAG: hypothetical protein BWY15_02063 [Firmicutes bacterium ADurb.Bin193]
MKKYFKNLWRALIGKPFVIGASYHDVTVVVNGKKMRLFDSGYNLILTCTRSSGWELWSMEGSPSKEWRLIGGEYDNAKFHIEVDGKIICFN